MADYGHSIYYNEATHHQQNSHSMIDVVFCNDPDFHNETEVLTCPFSNDMMPKVTDIKPLSNSTSTTKAQQ